jgi:hypothetical protein
MGQDKRGTEAQVDSTITFAIAVRRTQQQAASETRPSQQDTHARLEKGTINDAIEAQAEST